MPEVFENYGVYKSVTENEDYSSHGHDLIMMNSPFNGSQGMSAASPSSTFLSSSLSPLYNMDMNFKDVTVIGEPYLTIVEQPIDKFRFRYKSEMIGTHGSLVGSNAGSGRNKNFPTVQLHNFPTSAKIQCTLVTSEEGKRIPHAHRLVRRVNGEDYDDPHIIDVTPENGFIAKFHGMGIIHTAKKYVREELIKKMRHEAIEKKKRECGSDTLTAREEVQIKHDADIYQKCVNLNSVALCFQAFILDECNVMRPIQNCIVYSKPINNLKSALTGELKICRIDKHTSSVDGDEDVFLLVEKVGKKNIKVRFFEVDEDNVEVWSDYGRFTELDVHHQYAIVFRTPRYKDLTITSPKEVYVQLERPSDGDCSEPLKFIYKPSDRIIGKKRQRISYSGSSDLSNFVLPNFNSETGNISGISNGDSREISREIKKFFSRTEDVHTVIDNINIDEYFAEFNEEFLTTDGPSSKQHKNDIMFPKNILMEAMKYMILDPENSQTLKILKDRSTFGDSALHAAFRYGQRDIVKYMLMLISSNKDSKILVNEQNSSGKTPLHFAVLQNFPESIEALLMLGADPNRSDEYGCCPLHIAVQNPQAGACVKALLSDKKTKMEIHNDAGWTPLQLAAGAGSYTAVCLLAEAGVNVNSVDMSYGRTALHIAVEGGHIDIIKYLVEKTNIDINKPNFSGNTALHSAVIYSGVRSKESVASLMKHGADPYIQNHNRETSDDDRETTHVKEEVNSDDENSEDENSEELNGQSSFDLAMSKPDILQLLNGQTEEATNEISFVSTKEEIQDEDLQKDLLNNEQKYELAYILDETEGWRKLAKHLKCESFLRTLQHTSLSPSRLLLNYIDVQSLMSLTDLERALRDIDETEAANCVNEIIRVNMQS